MEDYRVQEIKEIARIEEVVSRFMKLRKSGSRFIGYSPEKEERTPSFVVTPSLNICKDFSIGEKGMDSIGYLMHYQKMKFNEAITYLGEMYGITINNKRNSKETRKPKNIIVKKATRIKPISYLDVSILKDHFNNYPRNNFIIWLSSKIGTESANRIVSKYYVGTSKHYKGASIFFQIDYDGNIRGGKEMDFSPKNGKRNKGFFNSIQSRLSKDGGIIEFNWKECIYGEHLLKGNNKTVAIVEAESTALIMCHFYPDLIWLATGGKGKLDKEKLHNLTARSIILFPDVDGYELWGEIAIKLSKTMNVNVSQYLLDNYKKFGLDDRSDIADLFLKSDIQRVNTEIQQKENKIKSFVEASFASPPSPFKKIDQFKTTNCIPAPVKRLNKVEVFQPDPTTYEPFEKDGIYYDYDIWKRRIYRLRRITDKHFKLEPYTIPYTGNPIKDIEVMEKEFSRILSSCEINWFGNSWMNSNKINKLDWAKYWCS